MAEPDAELLAGALRRDFPVPAVCADEVDTAPVPVRIIDCVLSLGRPYDTVVRPRVVRFLAQRPEVRTCEQLRTLMRQAANPAEFLRQELDTNDAGRADVLLGVVEFALRVQGDFRGDTEDQRMTAWALDARPGDYLATGVRGFGIAGFQYLRLLCGADTAKPDVHILRYVAEAVGRKVSEVEAVLLLERAGKILGVPVRNLDRSIWEKAAR